MKTRIAIVFLLAATLGLPILATAQPQQRPPAQSEFVPVDELPQAEQLPAAPLVITAYSVAWVAMFIYLWSIWRRLRKVEQELSDVSRRVTERSRT
ncbi:MAG TPA: CcmD family protein [Vicinamibacterales bacterium]|nr:CcmD family protein [Vicinamibacterales bacterium]